MSLLHNISDALAYISRVCGFETVDRFPPGHRYAHTRWNRAYFDIASDLSPARIEQSIGASIANTPQVFAYIEHPTPAMQRALLDVIHARLRRSCGSPLDLVALLVQAYASPHTPEAVPGLRAIIEATLGYDMSQRANAVLGFLGTMPAAFNVIEAGP